MKNQKVRRAPMLLNLNFLNRGFSQTKNRTHQKLILWQPGPFSLLRHFASFPFITKGLALLGENPITFVYH